MKKVRVLVRIAVLSASSLMFEGFGTASRTLHFEIKALLFIAIRIMLSVVSLIKYMNYVCKEIVLVRCTSVD